MSSGDWVTKLNLSLQAVAQVLVVAGAGAWLTKRRGFDKPAIAAVSSVNWHMLIPCLLFSSIVAALTPDTLVALAPLLLLSLLHVLLGLLPALALGLLARLPRDLLFFTTMASCLPNCGNLPWLFMPALIRYLAPPDQAEQQVQYAVGLVSVYTIMIIVVTLTVPFVVKREDEQHAAAAASAAAGGGAAGSGADTGHATAHRNWGLQRDVMTLASFRRRAGLTPPPPGRAAQGDACADAAATAAAAAVLSLPGEGGVGATAAAAVPADALALHPSAVALGSVGWAGSRVTTAAACEPVSPGSVSIQMAALQGQVVDSATVGVAAAVAAAAHADVGECLDQLVAPPASIAAGAASAGGGARGSTAGSGTKARASPRVEAGAPWAHAHVHPDSPGGSSDDEECAARRERSRSLLLRSRQLLGSFSGSLRGGLQRVASASQRRVVWSWPLGWQLQPGPEPCDLGPGAAPLARRHPAGGSACAAGCVPEPLRGAWRWLRRLLSHPVFNLPLGATLLGVVCAAVEPLRHALVGERQALHFLWLSLSWIGAAAAPLATMQMGAELAAPPAPSAVPLPRSKQAAAIAIAVSVKLLLVPLLNVLLLQPSALGCLLPPGDVVYQLLVLVEAAVPAAVTLLVVCSRVYPNIRPLSTLLGWQYGLSIITLPAMLMWFLTIVGA